MYQFYHEDLVASELFYCFGIANRQNVFQVFVGTSDDVGRDDFSAVHPFH